LAELSIDGICGGEEFGGAGRIWRESVACGGFGNTQSLPGGDLALLALRRGEFHQTLGDSDHGRGAASEFFGLHKKSGAANAASADRGDDLKARAVFELLARGDDRAGIELHLGDRGGGLVREVFVIQTLGVEGIELEFIDGKFGVRLDLEHDAIFEQQIHGGVGASENHAALLEHGAELDVGVRAIHEQANPRPLGAKDSHRALHCLGRSERQSGENGQQKRKNKPKRTKAGCRTRRIGGSAHKQARFSTEGADKTQPRKVLGRLGKKCGRRPWR